MNARLLATILLALTAPATALGQAAAAQAQAARQTYDADAASDDFRYSVPQAVSPEAKAVLRPMMAAAKAGAPAQRAMAMDFAKLRAIGEAGADARMTALAAKLGVTYTADRIAGVPVLRIRSRSAATDGRVLIYVHGGGWIGGSVKSTFASPAHFAVATGLPVISVEYGLAPEHDFRDITGQIDTVYRALLRERHKPSEIGMFGDSAGGSIVPGTVLRLRDEGVALPAALVLLSPCTDLLDVGDTRTTLAYADPVLSQQAWLRAVMAAYRGRNPADATNPWASPVYGDYRKPFPPTLIQGGTREYLLSDFVREYQAIRTGGDEAILDLYEGMPHVFQSYLATTPEGQEAYRVASRFFLSHLSKH